MSKPITKSAPAAAPAPESITPETKVRVLGEIAVGGSRDADFALSLLVAMRKGKVSDKQQFHIDRMVNAHLNPMPTIKAERIIKAYQSLRRLKRYPKVTAVIGGAEVTISYTPTDSVKAKPENRGTCAVASGKWGSPDAKWYGRIKADGEFAPGHDITPEVAAWLVSLCNEETPIVWGF